MVGRSPIYYVAEPGFCRSCSHLPSTEIRAFTPYSTRKNLETVWLNLIMSQTEKVRLGVVPQGANLSLN